MKYLAIIALSFIVISCAETDYFNEYMSFIYKGMNEKQVMSIINEEPKSMRKIKVNNVEYLAHYYEYTVSTQISKSSTPVMLGGYGMGSRGYAHTTETNIDKDVFVLVYDAEGRLFHFGMTYDFMRSEDELINELGLRIGSHKSSSKSTDIH